MPFDPDVDPPLPVTVELDEPLPPIDEPDDEDELVVVVVVMSVTHSSATHFSPSGQMTPSHGHDPQAPVSGSQHPPFGQEEASHWLWMHVGGVWDMSQTWSLAHAGLHVSTQTPSLQTSSD